MVRRAVAALLMLVAVVLVHAVTPHHAGTTPRVNAAGQTPDQIRSGPHLLFDQIQAPSSLHDDQQDPLALPNRVQNSPGAMGAADGSQMDDAAWETRGSTAVSYPATARNRHRPTGAAAPTPSTLQTFRY
ncbi:MULTISPECIES: hypothetical protein [unclassified Streptomyces]|uniref:hypothetical protein n=1 Tax=unclassified Streptomyces TaxID=2593676 RepID=UPI00114CC8B7|nr:MULTISPECIES: hypothetical protein [unclassified Streptomyces]MYZ38889.1 hypothetical protein [Streptomyces sp. SID4917]